MILPKSTFSDNFCSKSSFREKEYFRKNIFPNDIFRTPINTYHTQIPLTDYVIYHEAALGPFKKGNSVFPTWTDKFHNNKEEIKKFKKELNKKLNKT